MGCNCGKSTYTATSNQTHININEYELVINNYSPSFIGQITRKYYRSPINTQLHIHKTDLALIRQINATLLPSVHPEINTEAEVNLNGV